MLGAIIGNIIGSPYEFDGVKVEEREFPLFKDESDFTDDTVMALAIAEALLEGGEQNDRKKLRALVIEKMRKLGRYYANAGYGDLFMEWLCKEEDEPYGSYGSGAAMRVAPVAWMYEDLETVEEIAELTASVTHNHPEGIKGAKAVAAAIFMARTGSSRYDIKKYVEEKYGYNLSRELSELQREGKNSSDSEVVVPGALIAFLESEDFESAVRKAVSIGGNTDTLGAVAGAVAEAYYSLGDSIKKEAFKRLPANLMKIMDEWHVRMNKKKTEKMYYDEAVRYATMMHEGQNRIGGEPYVTHPLAVAEILKKKGFPIEYRIAAVFHDLLEDTEAEDDVIMAYGGQEVLKAVKLMTKEYNYNMADYIERIKANPITMNVKAADRLHNLSTAGVTDWRFKKRYVEETKKWFYDFPGWEDEIKAINESLEKTIPEEYRSKPEEEAKKGLPLKNLFEMSGEVFTRLDKGAFLTTKSEGRKNTMIISWGALGEIWGKPMMMIMVRKSRFTHDILEKSRGFTVSFTEPGMFNQEKGVAGTMSGRSLNKFAKTGLMIKDAKYVDAPVLDIPGMHFECSIFYTTDVDAGGMSKENFEEFYSDNDIHTLYFAEIIEAYRTE